jgi:hypothetical protein
MKKLLVKSIIFYVKDDDSFADYLDVQLSTNGLDEAFRLRMNKPITIVDHGDRERGEMKLTRKLTDAEQRLILLVLTCCADYLEGREPESLDTLTLAYIEELSTRFDWTGAGYGPEGEKGERYVTLADHIAHFWSIG